MSFYLQDPGDLETTYLIEVLVEHCQTATGGGGSFAWATSRGVNLLLENNDFVHFLRNNDFDLILGVDSVTDETALAALNRIQKELVRLKVSVFLNVYAGPLFHPKVCWFRKGTKGTLITGSGNLTEGGLSRNWEAFTVTSLDKAGIEHVEQQWLAWKTAYKDDLYEPLDPLVVARAKKNVRPPAPAAAKGSAGKKPIGKRLPGNKRIGTKVLAPKAASVTLDVLVAEISAGIRWKQANFHREHYENFFGAKVGTQRFMFFRHVKLDGTVGATETRPSVDVRSQNWRFELAAASGLSYPQKGRPIGLFVKQAARNFLYQLLMPGESGHTKLDALLAANWTGPARFMRQVRVTRAAAESAWPESRIWSVLDSDAFEEGTP